MDALVKIEIRNIVDRIWGYGEYGEFCLKSNFDLRVRELQGKELQYHPQGIKFYHILKSVMIDKFGSNSISKLREYYNVLNISFDKDRLIEENELEKKFED